MLLDVKGTWIKAKEKLLLREWDGDSEYMRWEDVFQEFGKGKGD